MKKTARKMSLNRETVRRLASERLEAAAGGGIVQTHSCAGSCFWHTCATCARDTCVVC